MSAYFPRSSLCGFAGYISWAILIAYSFPFSSLSVAITTSAAAGNFISLKKGMDPFLIPMTQMSLKSGMLLSVRKSISPSTIQNFLKLSSPLRYLTVFLQAKTSPDILKPMGHIVFLPCSSFFTARPWNDLAFPE